MAHYMPSLVAVAIAGKDALDAKKGAENSEAFAITVHRELWVGFALFGMFGCHLLVLAPLTRLHSCVRRAGQRRGGLR